MDQCQWLEMQNRTLQDRLFQSDGPGSHFFAASDFRRLVALEERIEKLDAQIQIQYGIWKRVQMPCQNLCTGLCNLNCKLAIMMSYNFA
eukprot:8565537-Karenia_brevis.AAC.1